MSDEIDQIYDQFPSSQLRILGDFNLPHSGWLNDDLSSIAAPSFRASPTEAKLVSTQL